MEQVLGWAHGSFDRILTGGEPAPIQMAEQQLTAEQQALRRVFDAWERDHGPEKAMRMLRDEVDRLNAERAERPAG
jgi:hypothetical protein